MEQDPNKKQDQNPKKPSIKIKQINIPENLRTLLNPGQGQGQGQGAGVRTGPAAASAFGPTVYTTGLPVPAPSIL